jgi:hypothetical protein
MKIDDIRRWLQGEPVSGLPEGWKKKRLQEARSALVDVLQQQENAKRFAEGDEAFVREVACPHCHGSGKILTSRHAQKKGVREWAVCPKCRGAGTISELAWQGKEEAFPDVPQRRVAPGVYLADPTKGVPMSPEWDDVCPFKVEFRGWPQMYLAPEVNVNAATKRGEIRVRFPMSLSATNFHGKELWDFLSAEEHDIHLYSRGGAFASTMREALATRASLDSNVLGTASDMTFEFIFQEWESA